jgi:hypothetical protein
MRTTTTKTKTKQNNKKQKQKQQQQQQQHFVAALCCTFRFFVRRFEDKQEYQSQ